MILLSINLKQIVCVSESCRLPLPTMTTTTATAASKDIVRLTKHYLIILLSLLRLRLLPKDTFSTIEIWFKFNIGLILFASQIHTHFIVARRRTCMTCTASVAGAIHHHHHHRRQTQKTPEPIAPIETSNGNILSISICSVKHAGDVLRCTSSM